MRSQQWPFEMSRVIRAQNGEMLLNLGSVRVETNALRLYLQIRREQEEGDWFRVSQEEVLREVGETSSGTQVEDGLLVRAGRSCVLRIGVSAIVTRSNRAQGPICLLGTRRTRCFRPLAKGPRSPCRMPQRLPVRPPCYRRLSQLTTSIVSRTCRRSLDQGRFVPRKRPRPYLSLAL